MSNAIISAEKLNLVFETADDDVIDFSESNPFGTIGSTTDFTI